MSEFFTKEMFTEAQKEFNEGKVSKLRRRVPEVEANFIDVIQDYMESRYGDPSPVIKNIYFNPEVMAVRAIVVTDKPSDGVNLGDYLTLQIELNPRGLEVSDLDTGETLEITKKI